MRIARARALVDEREWRSRFRSHGSFSRLANIVVLLLFTLTVASVSFMLVRPWQTAEDRFRRRCREPLGLCSVDSAVPKGDDAASQRLAVIVPYRDREEHLKTMLLATRECLQRSNQSGAQ